MPSSRLAIDLSWVMVYDCRFVLCCSGSMLMDLVQVLLRGHSVAWCLILSLLISSSLNWFFITAFCAAGYLQAVSLYWCRLLTCTYWSVCIDGALPLHMAFGAANCVLCLHFLFFICNCSSHPETVHLFSVEDDCQQQPISVIVARILVWMWFHVYNLHVWHCVRLFHKAWHAGLPGPGVCICNGSWPVHTM